MFLFRIILRNDVYASDFVAWVHANRWLFRGIVNTSRKADVAIFYKEDIFWYVKFIVELNCFPWINWYNDELDFVLLTIFD